MTTETTGMGDDLVKTVLSLLPATPQGITIRDLEFKLREKEGVISDTFDVRDAVWKLVSRHLADFTELRAVRKVEQPQAQNGGEAG